MCCVPRAANFKAKLARVEQCTIPANVTMALDPQKITAPQEMICLTRQKLRVDHEQ